MTQTTVENITARIRRLDCWSWHAGSTSTGSPSPNRCSPPPSASSSPTCSTATGSARRSIWPAIASVTAAIATSPIRCPSSSKPPAPRATSSWRRSPTGGPTGSPARTRRSRNCLGQGNRANATIGRALRLVAMNIIGAKVGLMDGSSIGNPGKYALCFAESEPVAPWGPLRVELGFGLEETTVTLLASEGPRQIANILSGEPDWVLRTMASSLRAGHTYIAGKGGQCICLLGPEHAAAVRDAGWSRRRAREYIATQSRISAAELEAAGVPVESTGAHTMVQEADGLYATFRDPEDILLVCAGGGGAGWSACIPAWAPTNNSKAVTQLVRV